MACENLSNYYLIVMKFSGYHLSCENTSAIDFGSDLINRFTNRLKNWYGAMPYVNKHTRNVSTRSVESYPYESSREKRQQDRQTDGQTHRRIVQNHFSRRFEDLHPKFGLIIFFSRFFARCQYYH